MSKSVIPLTLILVCESGVGKTCLANQLVNKCFDEYSESTSGTDLFRYKMELDQCIVDLTLKDTVCFFIFFCCFVFIMIGIIIIFDIDINSLK